MRPMRCFLLLCCLPFAALAQRPLPDHLERLPRLQLAQPAIDAAIRARKHEPLRYAVPAALGAGTGAGSWDEPQAGIARWRLQIGSDTARSLSFRLGRLQLPAGAELWIYSADGRDAQGPFTTANAPRYTPLVRGQTAVIEARMPSAAKEEFAIQVAAAYHGYRDLVPQSFDNTSGISGSCNVDVACPAGNNWRRETRATVLLTIDNSTLCSGTLINNTAQDGRPLILTANHCGITSANVSDTTAYFSVQSSTCNGADGLVNRNIAGQTLLARSASGSRTDYTIFELAATPPREWAPYYSGWDARGTAPNSGVGIHHPSGDDKKISTFSDRASSTTVCIGGNGPTCLGGFSVDSWALIWDQGTTEEGSSGSGLWNQNHHLVGTLSGGLNECLPGSTQNNGEADVYGRLDKAWTASSTTSLNLQGVLDPTASGTQVLEGKDVGEGSEGSLEGGGSFGWNLLPLAFAALLRRRLSRDCASRA